MNDDIDPRVERSGHGSVIRPGFWGGCVVTVFLLCSLVFGTAICEAAELPSVAELRQDSARLLEMSGTVQGSFRVFRSETVIPEALDKPPADLEIPLEMSGSLWRSKDRFRADYMLYQSEQGTRQFQCAVAEADGRVYQLSCPVDSQGGMLNVYDADSPGGAAVKNFIEHTFYEPLDSLSSHSQLAFVDWLQHPGTKLELSKKFPGGHALLSTSDEGGQARFDFEPARNRPFGYSLATEELGDMRVRLERRVFSIEKDGATYPSRFVDVAWLDKEGNGDTLVVILDLEPLQTNSPISSSINSASFRNLGVGYQVYHGIEIGGEIPAERFGMPQSLPPNSASEPRSYFLWLNGALIVAVAAWVIYLGVHRWKKRL
jgi:hypothetical protein